MSWTYSIILSILLGSAASAANAIVESFGGGSPFGSYYGSTEGDVVGYTFVTSETVTVSALGIRDDGSLDHAHPVGLWSFEGLLLASTTVDASGLLKGSFYYQSITPLTLAPGSYVLGALYVDGWMDSYISGATDVVTGPGVALIQGRFPAMAGLGFVFPKAVSGLNNRGRFGPNALFESGAEVPEPGMSWSLILILSCLVRQRRRQ